VIHLGEILCREHWEALCDEDAARLKHDRDSKRNAQKLAEEEPQKLESQS
jgi:hypothetical protein